MKSLRRTLFFACYNSSMRTKYSEFSRKYAQMILYIPLLHFSRTLERNTWLSDKKATTKRGKIQSTKNIIYQCVPSCLLTAAFAQANNYQRFDVVMPYLKKMGRWFKRRSDCKVIKKIYSRLREVPFSDDRYFASIQLFVFIDILRNESVLFIVLRLGW